MSNYKKYNEKHYAENDAIAKETAIKFLESQGHILKDHNQEEYYKKCDFVIFYNDQERLIEVERKLVWDRSGEWQSGAWRTIDVPYRKKDSQSHWYILFNKSWDTLAIIKMKTVLTSPVATKNTIYTKGEPFFNVPVSSFRFYTLKSNVWTKI